MPRPDDTLGRMVTTPIDFRVPADACTWTPTPEAATAIVQRVVERLNPLKVVVFGSAARDDVGRDSDVDLLVVVDDGADVARAEIDARRAAIGLGVGLDVVVTTPSGVERARHRWESIEREALQEGIEVFDRTGGMNLDAAFDPTTPAEEEVGRWLRLAQSNLDAARLLVRHGSASSACMVAQFAAENALKAELIRRRVAVPRTHRVEDLTRHLKAVSDIDFTENARSIDEWHDRAEYPSSTSDDEYYRAAVQAVDYATAVLDRLNRGPRETPRRLKV